MRKGFRYVDYADPRARRGRDRLRDRAPATSSAQPMRTPTRSGRAARDRSTRRRRGLNTRWGRPHGSPSATRLALGLAQGPTELLPISSSAHTILIPCLAGWPYGELDPELRKSFEVALHAGTAAALLVDLRSVELTPPGAALQRLAPPTGTDRLGSSGSGLPAQPPHRRLPPAGAARRALFHAAGRGRLTSSAAPTPSRRAARRSPPVCSPGSRRWRSPTRASRTGHARCEHASARDGLVLGLAQSARADPRRLAQRRDAHRGASARIRPRRCPYARSWHAACP